MIVAFRMKTTEVVPPTSTYEKAPVPTARPNFEIAGIAQERVVIHPVASFGATHRFVVIGDEKPVLALIFRIENVPGSAALEARDVIAKISFRSLTGHEEEQIQYGVWLDTVCNSVDLDLGDTRELVVVMPIKGTLYAIEDRRTLNHDYHAPGAWFALKKVDDLESVEVRIIDPQAKNNPHICRRLSFDGEHFHIGPDQNQRISTAPSAPGLKTVELPLVLVYHYPLVIENKALIGQTRVIILTSGSTAYI